MDLKTETALRRHLKLPFLGELDRSSSRNILPATYLDWIQKTGAACRELLDRTEKETRDLTADEKLAFDEGLRLVDYWKTALGEKDGRRSGRLVPPEQIHGVPETRGPDGPAMRFLTSSGKEIRGLRPDESIATDIEYELPDGITKDELSLGRLVRAATTGDWSKARAEQRAMGGSSDVSGGYLVPFALAANVIDLARNKAVVFNAGAITVPMETATLAIAKLTGEAGALAWKVENQPAPLSDAQFGKVTLTARTLFGACAVSLEAVQDASNIDQVIENSLAMSAALALDLAALRGDGTAASPIGIRNAPGVQLVDLGTNGATLTSTTFYPKWSQACQLIMQKNGIPRTTIFAPRTWSEQDLLANTLNDALEAPDSWKNLQKLVTNQVPINNTKGSSNASSEAYVGDFQQMLVGIRSELNLEISRVAGDSTGSAFRSGQIWIRIFMRADIQLARPEHFVLIDGIL